MGAADGVGESRDARDDLDCPLEPGSSSWGRWEVGGGIVQALRVLVDARAPIHCGREKGGGMYLPADDPLVHTQSMYIPGACTKAQGIQDSKDRNHVPWDLNGGSWLVKGLK